MTSATWGVAGRSWRFRSRRHPTPERNALDISDRHSGGVSSTRSVGGVNYRYELRRGDVVVATGHLSRERPLEVGETLEIGGQLGIVRTIEPLLGEQELRPIRGAPPSLLALPEGCAFRPRCPHEFDRCSEVPGLDARLEDAAGHCDRCWLAPEQKRKLREVAGGIGLEAPA